MWFYSVIVIIDVVVPIGCLLDYKSVILYKHDINLILVCLEICLFFNKEEKLSI